MSWAVTPIGRHWLWTVWTADDRRSGISGSEDLATRQAKLLDLRANRTSSVEHPPVADSAEPRTPGTPDPPNRKDRST